MTGRPGLDVAHPVEAHRGIDVLDVGLVHDDRAAVGNAGEQALPFVGCDERAGGIVRVAEPDQPGVVLARGFGERVDVVATVAARDVDHPRPRGGGGGRVEPVGRGRLDDRVAGLQEGVDDRGDERLDPMARNDPLGRRAQPGRHALAQIA